MNVMNRLIVILEMLVAVIVLPVLIVLFIFFLPGIAAAASSLGRSLNSTSTAFLIQLICVAMALLFFVIAVILLFLEFNRPTLRRLRVNQVTDGEVEVTDDAITQRLEYTISQIAEVAVVKPRVAASKGNTVDAFIELETTPEVNVPQKTQEVIAAAKQVMEQQMGLQVGKIQVQLNYSRKQTKSQKA